MLRTSRFVVCLWMSLLLLICVGVSPLKAADTSSGAISGVVMDELDAGLVGANVEAFNCTDYSYRAGTFSGEDGAYRLQTLSDGCYLLRFSAPGHKSSWYGEPPIKQRATWLNVAGETIGGIDGIVERAEATITGRVVDSAGAPLPNTWVMAGAREEGRVNVSDAMTNAQGVYTINVDSGDHLVVFEHFGYVPEVYGGYGPESVTLETRQGQVVSGIDAELEQGGSIRGRVVDEQGHGIPEINVVALGASIPISGRSDANGYFEVDGLPAGNYTLMYMDRSLEYQRAFYYNPVDAPEPTPVKVAVPQTTPVVDVVLEPSGGISGWVTDTEGNGIAEVMVFAFPADGRGVPGFGTTTESGEYTIPGLPTGQYHVSFQARNDVYLRMLYPDADSRERAVPVSVVTSQTTSGINQVLPRGIRVFGSVKNASGEPLAGTLVLVIPKEGDETSAGYGATDEDGHYSLAVHPGEYLAQFRGANGYLTRWSGGADGREEAESFVISSEAGAQLDMVLPRGGSISGFVSNKIGAPIAGVRLQAYSQQDGMRMSDAVSDEEGNYSIIGLASGYYTLTADGSDSGYVKQTLPQGVEVQAPRETTQVNLALTQGGALAGVVTNDDGQPLERVRVEVYDPVTWNEIGNTRTDADGVYSVGGLPLGNYSVHFEKEGYVVQWYAGKTRREDATTVNISDTSTRSGTDAVLYTGVPLSGVVTDTNGLPLFDVEIGLYGDVEDEPFDEIHTGYDGRFTFENLAPGSYRVRFGTTEHIPRWFGGAHRKEASSLDVGGAGISNLSMALEMSPFRVAGKLRNSAGEKVGQAWMTAINAETNLPVADERICECSGKFNIPLEMGRYKLRVERYGEVYWYGGNSLETAQVVNVESEVAGLDMLIE